MPAAPNTVSITTRAGTESPHRRRYSIQPAAIRPTKPTVPANDASTKAPARRVMAPPSTSVEAGAPRLRLRCRQRQRPHRLFERPGVVAIPPRQEASAQGLDRLFPPCRTLELHLAHDWSPPPHDSLLLAGRLTGCRRPGVTIAFSPLLLARSKRKLGPDQRPTRSRGRPTRPSDRHGPRGGWCRSVGRGAGGVRTDRSYLDDLQILGGPGQVTEGKVVEDEAGVGVSGSQGLRLLPAGVHCGRLRARRLGDGHVRVRHQLLQRRADDGVASVGKHPVVEVESVATTLHCPVVEGDGLVTDACDLPAARSLVVGDARPIPELRPIPVPSETTELLHPLSDAGRPHQRQGARGVEGTVEQEGGKAQPVVAVEVGEEDGVDTPGVDAQAVQVVKDGGAGVEQETIVDNHGPVVALEREGGPGPEEGELHHGEGYRSRPGCLLPGGPRRGGITARWRPRPGQLRKGLRRRVASPTFP